jgi:transposase
MKESVFVGIDWAGEEHQVCIIDEEGKTKDDFSIPDSPQGIDVMVSRIKQLAGKIEKTPVIIETSHGLLFAELVNLGFLVYPVNPKSASRYKESLKVSKVKTDSLDAYALAHMLRTHQHQMNPFISDSLIVKKLRIITRDYRELHRDKVAICNKLRACLKSYYPISLELFSKLTQNITIEFLKKWPTPQDAAKISKEDILDFFAESGSKRTDKADEILKKLKGKNLEAQEELSDCHKKKMLTLARMLENIIDGQKELVLAMEELLGKHKDSRIFLSLPGTRTITAASLLAEIGDNRTKFSSASALQSLSGTAPVTKESGPSRNVVFRASCIKPFRFTMQQLAGNSMRTCFWAQEYYEDQRARGKSHQMALRSLAHKWLRIIYKMWQAKTNYDEAKHLINKKQKGGKMAA